MKTSLGLLALTFALASAAAAPDARTIDAQDAKANAKAKPHGVPHVYKTVGDRGLRVFVLNPPDWKATDRRPAVVWFHGGGWEIGKGGPTAFNAQGEYFITRGVVSIQVEYQIGRAHV